MASLLSRLVSVFSRDDASGPDRRGPALTSGASLLQSLPGRLALGLGSVWLGLYILQAVTPLPAVVDGIRKGVSLGALAAIAWLAVLAVSTNRRAFLWRVRRKLILSYIFIGFVPVVLMAAFVLAGGVLLYVTIASYLFQEGFTSVAENIRQFADTSAIEIGRDPANMQRALARKYANLSASYPALSMAAVPTTAGLAAGVSSAVATAGPWAHTAAPTVVPAWVSVTDGVTQTLVDQTPSGASLLIRAVAPTVDGRRAVIADLPIDAEAVARLQRRSGTLIQAVFVSGCGAAARNGRADTSRGILNLFRSTVAFVDCVDWRDGQPGTVSINLDARVATLYNRLASLKADQEAASLGGSWSVFLSLLVMLGALFLVIQGAALVMGGVLAKSITSAVHELFEGTERVQRGDFTHRIRIDSRDQLGELADSFNRMSSSIEHLLHVQREKQRLDDELRIAREIQKSLLPIRPPTIAGLDIADLCEPAREVGGDYYDFFQLGPRQLGLLVADVSGKGTSAALYTAELKGIMLALSHNQPSPRQLLIEVNRLLAEHLDNRSFITMTYAVVDLDARTLTFARAGHTPLMLVSNGRAESLIPEGMVLGLRLPGATRRFDDLLVEQQRPIADGDVLVLYTDGITEAMDAAGDLFGEPALTRVVTAQHTLDAAGIRERVLRDVRAFVGDAEPHDDMTMVIVKIG